MDFFFIVFCFVHIESVSSLSTIHLTAHQCLHKIQWFYNTIPKSVRFRDLECSSLESYTCLVSRKTVKSVVETCRFQFIRASACLRASDCCCCCCCCCCRDYEQKERDVQRQRNRLSKTSRSTTIRFFSVIPMRCAVSTQENFFDPD